MILMLSAIHMHMCTCAWKNVGTPHVHLDVIALIPGLGSSTVDQVLKYTKYPEHLPSTCTGQVLIFLKVLKHIKYFHIKYKYKYSY